MAKREDYISWDEYFMGVALLSAMRSKDPNTQVGACLLYTSKSASLAYFAGIVYNNKRNRVGGVGCKRLSVFIKHLISITVIRSNKPVSYTHLSVAVSTADVESSRISILGFLRSALAIQSLCF